MTDLNPRDIALELARLRSKVDRSSHASGLAHSSIEDGSVRAFDSQGTLTLQVGEQYDGTHAVSVMSGPIPPAPTPPEVTGGAAMLTVAWNGGFVGAGLTPMDFSRVEVYVSDVPFNTPTPNLLVGTIETPQGARVTVGVDPGTYYVRLASRSLSGKVSALTPPVMGEAFMGADPELIEEAITAANGKNKNYYSADAPDTDGTTPGDLWFQRDGLLIVGQWMWDGQDWAPQTIDGQVIANLDAGSITSGTISADRIASGAITADKISVKSITADKLIIGTDENVIADPQFRDTSFDAFRAQGAAWNYGEPLTGGARNVWIGLPQADVVRRFWPTAVSSDPNANPSPIVGVRPYRFTVYVSCSGSNVRFRMGARFYRWDADANQFVFVAEHVSSDYVIDSSGQAWVQWRGAIAAPSDYVVPWVEVFAVGANQSTRTVTIWGTTNPMRFHTIRDIDDFEDESIVARKIASGAVTTEKLAVGSVTADRLSSKSIGADKLGLGVTSTNLLSNPGFEARNPTTGLIEGNGGDGIAAIGWDVRSSTPLGWTGRSLIVVDRDPAYPARSGGACLMFVHSPVLSPTGKGTGPTASAIATIKSTPGRQYRFGCWVRNLSTTPQSMRIGAAFIDPSLGSGSVVDVSPANATNINSADGWVYLQSAWVTAPADFPRTIYLSLEQRTPNNAPSYQRLLVDDAFILEAGSANAELTGSNIRMWSAAGDQTVEITPEQGITVNKLNVLGSSDLGYNSAASVTIIRGGLQVSGVNIVTQWTAVTPTIANLVVGNGSATGRYKRIGSTVFYSGQFTFGSTSSFEATPLIQVPIPYAAATDRVPLGSAVVVDISAGLFIPCTPRAWSGTEFTLQVPSGGTMHNGSPMAWAAGDSFGWFITYEASTVY